MEGIEGKGQCEPYLWAILRIFEPVGFYGFLGLYAEDDTI